jgi:uncharacterized protein
MTDSAVSVVVFGAGGRAGRAAVGEARRRGFRVAAVVRDPTRYQGLNDRGVDVLAGDVTDPASVAALAAGHGAAIHAAAVYGEGTDPDAFFASAAHALVDGLAAAGVRRLVAIGLSTLVPGADGVRPVDAAAFPAQYRPFSLAHADGLDVLRTRSEAAAVAGTPVLDWVSLAPAGDFDHEHEDARTGRYSFREHGDPAARISYADFAIALLDEIGAPNGVTPHHRVQVAVG